MKIAVTAASGKLGSAIVKAVRELKSREDLIALARTPAKVQSLGVEVRPGDYNDKQALKQSLQGIDTVLLVSGMGEPKKRIGQHRNVIDAAKDAGVKKIVYTSVQGAEAGTAFSPVIQSNRQTEADIKASGLQWVIGRNGIYIEPDIDYLDSYVKAGGIYNCAGDKKCGYTNRPELAYAYAKMLSEDKHNGQIYNLHGQSLSQAELATYLSKRFNVDLAYHAVSFEKYRQDRINELGKFLGTVIAGIYQGIAMGKADNPSHYQLAAGREHQSWDSYFLSLKV
ncbi:SDR family oxidoreductase [Agaribacterium haliotis]|uniref:SDR family oxidoreductase n=1 Tax=Agaribacterium haliotis TaxID=2013869 RepID=UPI000BB5773C|nr:SDR family oxidoreductase [Agaribacterium haliotis]